MKPVEPPLASHWQRAGDSAPLGRLWSVWVLWGLASAILLLAGLPGPLRITVQDPDNYMRLLEVRDWLAGQSWWDVRQYRMNPPFGADMHWTRLVDVPIAAAILFFDLFLPADAAEYAAREAVPLVQLLIVMLLTRGLMRMLGASEKAALVACAIIPAFPLAIANYLPLRIDHHGWQGIGSLAVAYLMVKGGYRAAAAAGVIAAAWLTISVEGMPLAAIFGGLFGIRYWLRGQREHEGFLLGLAVASPLIYVATRPFGEWFKAYSDILSWPHFLAFAGAALVAVAARVLPRQDQAIYRLLSMVPIPLVAAPAVLIPLGIAAISPMSTLDPVLAEHWFRNIKEGIDISKQAPSIAAMLLWTIVIVAAGGRLALRQTGDPELREKWAMLTGAALGACGVSLLVMRAGLNAQLLALPFATLLLFHYMPRARAYEKAGQRIVATVCCIGLATPAFASALPKPLDNNQAALVVGPPKNSSDIVKRCDFRRLNALPPSRLFVTTDRGPQILVETRHTVEMGGYHRNQKQLRAIFDAFSGPIENARPVVRSYKSDYVVLCTSSADLFVHLTMGKDNLATALFYGNAPDWLEPVPGFEQGELRVWRVR